MAHSPSPPPDPLALDSHTPVELASPLHWLLAHLSAIPDPRSRATHRLSDVLLTALCALISGCHHFTEMAEFAETQLDWLRRYVPLAHGAPSHDCFRYVFSLINPEAFIDVMARWVGKLEGLQVCIDGKVSRGAKNPETGRSRLHLLRAWVGEHGLSVGQIACDGKTNELATLPELLASLELKSAVVSIDAMAGHPEIAQQIHTAQGDWILALKANEKEAYETISDHFRAQGQPAGSLPEGTAQSSTLHPLEIAPIQWPDHWSVSWTEEKNRGRYERREVICVPVDWWAKGFLWYGIQSAICVIRTTMRQRHGSEFPVHEVHYYLSSLAPDARQLGPRIRGHWGIENSCHHLLDVTFGEDHCQVRDQTTAHNLSLMRELAIKLLKHHPRKATVASKRNRAALSEKFRSEILAPLFP